jgi:hypothetical protein
MKIYVLIFLLLSAFSQSSLGFSRFDDNSLNQLLAHSAANQTSGVIWVWSPRMNISSFGMTELKPIAALLDLEVTVLVDPFLSEEEVYKNKYINLLINSQVLDSQELIRRGALVHFPVLFVYKNGQLLTPSRPGYDEPGRLYEYLSRRAR